MGKPIDSLNNRMSVSLARIAKKNYDSFVPALSARQFFNEWG